MECRILFHDLFFFLFWLCLLEKKKHGCPLKGKNNNSKVVTKDATGNQYVNELTQFANMKEGTSNIHTMKEMDHSLSHRASVVII
jgi:hypothetical protein